MDSFCLCIVTMFANYSFAKLKEKEEKTGILNHAFEYACCKIFEVKGLFLLHM